MAYEDIVKALLNEWNDTRQLTYDFLEKVPLDVINKKLPRPGLDTIAKHILEMSLVQKAYTRALEGKGLDFSEVEGITFGKEDYQAKSKDELVQVLQKADEHFRGVVNKVRDWVEKVELFGEYMPKYSIIVLLIRHETLHHGQFISFGYLLKIEFPRSWIETWALPTDK